MRKESYDFLKAIEETPSPSGFEQPVQRIVRERMKPFADRIDTDVHGNVTAVLNPKGHPRVMLAGHCDQIGLMVNYIDDTGYIFFTAIGGIDPSVLPGSRIVVHSKHGPIDGVVGRKPIHVLKPEERGAKIELREMWVDIGAKNKKEVEQVIGIGDPITFRLEMIPLGDDLVTSPAFDNKCGTFIVMEALRLCATKSIRCALFAVSTVQEEIGLRGARTSCFGIDPQVGIAVDVTHATDYPDIDKRVNGDIKIGLGPTISRGPNINPPLEKLLVSTAKSKRIPFQLEAEPGGTGTDANAMQLSRAGVATALLGIPNRYMHTQVEIVSRNDLDSAARLLAETIAAISPKMNFVPT
ncbi:MAG: M42 family metallopeptidase [Planctomycetes bacterium]|nr:M42 family metallopeptidase [Planctomycetota bacterium]MBI3832734.1 M42 family metallopeptidase [Planctomycetota bacterium]